MFCGLALRRDASLAYLLAPSGFCRSFLPFYTREPFGCHDGTGPSFGPGLGIPPVALKSSLLSLPVLGLGASSRFLISNTSRCHFLVGG